MHFVGAAFRYGPRSSRADDLMSVDSEFQANNILKQISNSWVLGGNFSPGKALMSETQEKLGTFCFGILWVRRVRTRRIVAGLSTCEKCAHVHANGIYGIGLWPPEVWIWDILKTKCECKKGWGGEEWAALGQDGAAKRNGAKKKKKKRKASLEKVCDVTCVM